MLRTISAVVLWSSAVSLGGAQEILPFKLRDPHIVKLTNGCLLSRIRVLTPPVGSSNDWAATTSFIYRRIKALHRFGDIEIDLRRDDEYGRPRIESGLALLGASDAVPGCPDHADKLDFFYLSTRLLTQRDLTIRRVNLELSILDETTADQKTRKLFKLPKDWRLPSNDPRNSQLVDAIVTAKAEQDAGAMIDQVNERLKALGF